MDKAMELLEQLATQLGVAVEYLWTTLVKQQYVEGVTSIVMAGVGVISLVVLICCLPKVTKFLHNKHKELGEDRRTNGTGYNGSYAISGYEEDFYGVLSKAVPIICFIVIFIIILCTVSDVKSGIQQLLNPEYFALKEILNVLGSTGQ